MRARRSRSTVLTAATLGVLIATGAVVASPAAYAADAPAAATASATPTATPTAEPTATPTATPTAKATADKPSLQVDAPASVGRGGEPVEFTEAVTNPGTTEATYKLKITTSGAGPAAPNAIKVDYRDADGTWKPVTDTVSGLTVAAGATKTVQLRLTTELAAYWSNVDSTVTLNSAVLDQDGAVLVESAKQVAAKAITLQVKDAPTTAVAGGAPVEFDVTIGNRSASGYTNVDKIIEADKHSTLQVRKADGGWQNLTGTPGTNPTVADRVTYHLADDRNMAPGETFTKHVRLAYTADAPLGTDYIHPQAVLDTGSGHAPSVVGPQYVQIKVTAAPVSTTPTLSVQEPASVGLGGAPVEFTETVTNPGTTEAPFTLRLNAANAAFRQHGAVTLEYRDADGTWKPIELAQALGDRTWNFTGQVTGLTVAPGATKTLQLRLATPGNNDLNGYNGSIKLYSAVVDPAENTPVAETTKDVAVKSLAVELKNAPTTAVIGGAPAEFDVTVGNPSASAFDKVTPILSADAHSTLQVQKADGSWQDVTSTPARQSGGPVSYRFGTEPLAANGSTTKHVRLAYTAGAAVGQTFVNPVAAVNEGTDNATASGPQGTTIELTAAPAGSTNNGTATAVKAGFTTASGSDSGTTGTTGTTDTTQLAGGELAHTGSSGMLQSLTGAAALLASGIGAVFFARRRRNA
ncbi:LPXTG cell wall anchor domain-containing protein [Kitasatospora sp. NPDC004669]|uniref:LPXTG cell wall anchor domain-containing protein n=1 Tax=Kitasatospora sp. NPDC004669 TaxID=3154555 RepID=UPI0033AFB8C3